MQTGQYVVVGGSKGIGRSIVERLLAEGHHVTVLSRTAEDLGGRANVTHVPFDVSKDTLSADQLPAAIHGLAYCPGTLNLKSFSRIPPEEFRHDFEINVVGAVRVLQAAHPALRAAKPASVLLFSTVAVAQGMTFHASIAAAKGAIEGLIRSLAAEWGPDVRVNGLAPALTNTALTARFFTDAERAKALAEKYVLARTGTADDLAAAAQFLLSPASGWITGQILGVDGGLSSVRK
jgi:NAD(P)-dependent dehydrogenase (short-subunit alcohol dehydrogenase family)